MSSRESISYLNIPMWKLPIVVSLVKLYMKGFSKDTTPYPKSRECLESLSKSATICVLSTSNKKVIEAFLARHNFLPVHLIYGNVPFLAKKKSLLKMLDHLDYSEALGKAYYVGDESRDIEAAKQAGIQSIAVSWGAHSKEFLEKQKATFLIHSWPEINELSL